uniref:Nuclease associated modular domain-containing protein n=1 Tax=Dactylella sp. TaxID=1814903 RepID=A0A482DTQ4_9PEZI|nr:hypothetical protein [Dactylella sp.]
MAIARALVKYGYSGFKLEILEYCDPDLAVIREQYFINLIQPENNILKVAGSSLGYKHTEETLLKLKGRKVSAETILKLKTAWLDRKVTSETQTKMAAAKGSGIVVILNTETNISQKYVSISQAAKEIKASRATISAYIKSQKFFQGKYKLFFKSI